MAVLDLGNLNYRTVDLPSEVVAAVAFQRGISRDETILRLRAAVQMAASVVRLAALSTDFSFRWVDDAGRPVLQRILSDVDRLGDVPVGLPVSAGLYSFAAFVAVMHFDDPSTLDPADAAAEVLRLPRSWWSTPLGVLCNRSLRVA